MCKGWYSVAITLLWQHVKLRHEGQIESIAQFASRPPLFGSSYGSEQHLGSFIKRLDFEPSEPGFHWAPYGTHTSSDEIPPTLRLCKQATNLRFLNIGAHTSLDCTTLNIYDSFPPTLEHLYVLNEQPRETDFLSLSQFVQFMDSHPQLSFFGPPGIHDESTSSKDTEIDWTGKSWSNLKELVFDPRITFSQMDRVGRLIPSGAFPNLERLSFNELPESNNCFTRFLHAHGKGLKALHMVIYDHHDEQRDMQDLLRAIPSLCPKLEELSFLMIQAPLDGNTVDWISEPLFPRVTTLGLRFKPWDLDMLEEQWQFFLNSIIEWLAMVPNVRTLRFYSEDNLEWLEGPDAKEQFEAFLEDCQDLKVSVEDNYGNPVEPYAGSEDEYASDT